jgi:hypothetical protein
MRRWVCVILAATVAGGCGFGWQEYESQRWGVRATFPAAPREAHWAVNTPLGRIGGVLVDVQVFGTRAEWYALFCLYVPDEFDRSSVSRAVEGEVARRVGRIVERTAAPLGTLQGTEVVIRGSTGTRRLRYGFAGRRLIGILARKGRFWRRSDEHFFESLEILEAWEEATVATEWAREKARSSVGRCPVCREGCCAP